MPASVITPSNLALAWTDQDILEASKVELYQPLCLGLDWKALEPIPPFHKLNYYPIYLAVIQITLKTGESEPGLRMTKATQVLRYSY